MNDLEKLLNNYKRRGGKRWRAEQASKIKSFVKECGGVSLHGIGKAHVIKHYKKLREQNRTDKTIMAHFYAISSLYEALGRNYEPPRPIFEVKNERETD